MRNSSPACLRKGVDSQAGTLEEKRYSILPTKQPKNKRMCFRKRNGYRPPDLFNAKIYTGPVPADRESPMTRSETSPSRAQHPSSTQKPNTCCFCWCCCCSCSWNEDDKRERRKAQETRLEPFPCEPCPKPTIEEIKQWAQSFDKLMKNPAGRNKFREFLRTEYSEENMLFWLACEDLKNESNKSAIEEKTRLIYEDYISILSPKEVSLDSRVREVINRRLQDPTPHIFEDAQLQIYTLMHRDSYPRFLNSSVYRSLVQGGSRSSSES
uniref:Regulator of G-protein signaling 20 n=1 Tax=Cyprinus carpio TaxID=7962 RepID=A0A8C1S3M3_CYPCA